MQVQKISKIIGLASLLAVTAAQSAFAAATYDVSPAGTGVTDQVQAVLTIVLPIAGGILALMVGWRLFKRFVKA
jgi:hypothetical protein